MLRVTKPNQLKTVECPFDHDEPKVTITFISSMDYDTRNQFYEMRQELDEESVMSAAKTFYRAVVKKCLQKIENVQVDQIPLTINGQGATDEVMDALQEVRIPGSGFDNLLSWAGSVIWSANTLDEEAKKKFEPSLSQEKTASRNSQSSQADDSFTLKKLRS